MNSISAKERSSLLKAKADIQLIDVREPYEHDAFNTGTH